MAQEKKKLRKIHKVSLLVVIGGVMLALYPLFTYAYSNYQQQKLQSSLPQISAEPAVVQPAEPLPAEESADTSASLQENSHKKAMFSLSIPKLKLSVAVVRGTSNRDLAKGPGWYEQSALPGEGNTAVAGHRTMHGAWFRHVDKLEAGDEIRLIYQEKTYIYKVEKVFPIAKNDWSVIDPTDHPTLTLTTCHPVGSAKQRLAVRATLEE